MFVIIQYTTIHCNTFRYLKLAKIGDEVKTKARFYHKIKRREEKKIDLQDNIDWHSKQKLVSINLHVVDILRSLHTL